jgi:putative PIN family toxin of toxin-antitoxin system
MRSSRRYVFDVNVIASVPLFPKSKPGQAFFQALQYDHILVSDRLIEELRDVLHHPKFDRYVTVAERDRLLATLVEEAVLIEIGEAVAGTISVCRDPNDNHILELAISDTAECIVSEDADLLVLNPYQGIPILSPDSFLAS